MDIAAHSDPRSRAPSGTLASFNVSHEKQVTEVAMLTKRQVASSHETHLHEQPERDENSKKDCDLGIAGVMLHIAGDAVNNIGVIVAGAVIWRAQSDGRYYADPAVGTLIALMILASSIPLGWSFDCTQQSSDCLQTSCSFANRRSVKKSGMILLQSVPKGVNPADVKHDIEKVRQFPCCFIRARADTVATAD